MIHVSSRLVGSNEVAKIAVDVAIDGTRYVLYNEFKHLLIAARKENPEIYEIFLKTIKEDLKNEFCK